MRRVVAVGREDSVIIVCTNFAKSKGGGKIRDTGTTNQIRKSSEGAVGGSASFVFVWDEGDGGMRMAVWGDLMHVG